MMMLVTASLAAAAVLTAGTSEPPRGVLRAQVRAMVRIIQAAEVRDGQTDVPHRRRERIDSSGAKQILIEFE